MNVKSILIWAMAIGTLSSCMSNEDMYDPEKAEALKVAKYEAAFVKKYGKVDPKQDWGFGEAEAAMQAAATRTLNANANIWGVVDSYVIVPPAVDDEEKQKVLAAFNTPVEEPQNMEIKWSDFFIQQVYKNEEGHWANDGQSLLKPSDKMNNFKYGEFTIGNNAEIKEDEVVVNGNKVRQRIVFFQNEPWGKTFEYTCVEDGKIYGKDNYLIKKVGDAYYVGFDFEAKGGGLNQQVDRDYVFNDVIFKIVPAKYRNARRIMAEDLAVDNKSDFDFNDVVFDAVIINGEAVITLQAVGGTLPLCVGDESHEVHDLFGVGPTEFVNTQSREEKAPVMFRIPNVNSLRDIRIIVDGANISNIQTGNKNMNAPAKLCCPTDYKWADERNSIDNSFPNFKKAVGNSDELWYKDGAKEWQ